MPKNTIKAAMIICWLATFVVAVLATIMTPWLFFPAGVLLGSAAVFTGVYYTDEK